MAAHAQAAKSRAEALPVWNQSNGKVEAVLLLEPMSAGRWKFGNTTLEAALGVGSGNQLGLICDRSSGLATIGNLADNCKLATLGSRPDVRQAAAGASLSRNGGRIGLGVGSSRDVLPAWLTPGGKDASRLEQNTLTLIGQKNVGREAKVSIGGTIARARLVSAESVPALADRWDVKTLSLGANVGRFGANVIGRVVESPESDERWSGLGLGLTWRTPWSGQLSVGADNVVTRGKNPFAPRTGDDQEDTVPYVRYQQDL
jgi:hypothetical protein